DRDAASGDELEESGGDAAAPQRTEMPAEPAVGAHPGEAVDQAEKPEPENREQHLAPRKRQARVINDVERAQDRASVLDEPHGDNDVETARGGDHAVAVVAPLEYGRSEDVAAHHAEEAHRHHADDEADDDDHVTVLLRARVRRTTQRARRVRSRTPRTSCP